MKKVMVLWAILVTLSLFGWNNANSGATDTKPVASKLPYEFKIVVTGYFKITKLPDGKWSNRQYVKTDKEYPVLAMSMQGLTLYEIEVVSNNNEKFMRPKLDANGNSIPLRASTSKADLMGNIINGSMAQKIIGNVPDEVFIGFTLKKNGFVGFARTFYRYDHNKISLSAIPQFMIKDNPLFDSNLAFIYADSDLNYQIRKLNSKGLFEISYQNSVNPDIDDIDKHVGIEHLVDYAYFLNNEEGKGYLSLSPNNKQFISNGKKSELGYKPKLINNKLFVHAQWFVSQVYGFMDYDTSEKALYKIKRLYQRIGDPIELLDIELVRYDDIVTLNGTKYKLSAKPIFESAYTMMPLRDLCELLKVRLIYQPITNTYLIQRFNTAYNPPFNLQKVE